MSAANTAAAAAAAALRQRALTGMLFNALACPARPEGFNFWQGYAKALADLAAGTGDKLAAKDGASGYELPGYVAVAARCLGDDVYRLPRGEVLDRLARAGIEVATHALATLDVVAAHQLENGAVGAVDLHDEHAANAVVVGDGSIVRHDDAPKGVVSAIVSPLVPPAIGEYWPGQGGIYVGICEGEAGQPRQHLIVATTPGSRSTGKWGEYGQDVEGAHHQFDGRANTVFMADAGSEIAKQVLALEIEGHQDYFIASKSQLALARANALEQFDKAIHWSSTQDSRNGAFAQGFETGGSDWATSTASFGFVPSADYPFNT